MLFILHPAALEVRDNWSKTSCPASEVFALDPAAQRLALAAWGGSVDKPPKWEKLKARTKAKITRCVPQVGCTLCWAVFLDVRI